MSWFRRYNCVKTSSRAAILKLPLFFLASAKRLIFQLLLSCYRLEQLFIFIISDIKYIVPNLVKILSNPVNSQNIHIFTICHLSPVTPIKLGKSLNTTMNYALLNSSCVCVLQLNLHTCKAFTFLAYHLNQEPMKKLASNNKLL